MKSKVVTLNISSMNSSSNRSPFTQKRIDYIVYGNPKGVRQLLRKQGKSVPRDVHALVDKTKYLIRKEGQPFVKALLHEHPDRKALLKTHDVKTSEYQYCGACQHFSYDGESNFCGNCGSALKEDHKNLPSSYEHLSLSALEQLYQEKSKQASLALEDQVLRKEAESLWNALRLRKLEEGKHTNDAYVAEKECKSIGEDSPQKEKSSIGSKRKDKASSFRFLGLKEGQAFGLSIALVALAGIGIGCMIKS